MTEDTAHTWDVIVVGAGPVGSTTALTLARGGKRVLLLEKREAALLEHRASTFHPPTLEMLDDLGLAQPLLDEGIVAHSYQFRDARSGPIVTLDYGVLAEHTRFPFRLQVEQSRLTSIALAALDAEPGVEVRTAHEAVDARRVGCGFEVVVQDEDGVQTVERTHRLIAADGSRSRLREVFGIGFTGRTYPELYLVITTGLPLHEMLEDLAVVNYVADPVDWHVLLRNPSGWRVLFPVSPEADPEQLLDPEHVRSVLARVVDLDDEYPVKHVTLYQVHRKVAETFRQDELYLVGDAAHVNNPLGGMGMNSGIHDGVLLARTLLQSDAGEVSDGALDKWAQQRRSVALEFVGEQTEGNWNALRDTDDDRRAQQRRQWEMLGEDELARRSFLLTSSMIASVPS